MNCRTCGEQFPNYLLRQDSFRCPKCGKAYHRNTKSDQSGVSSKKADAVKAPRKAVAGASRTVSGARLPKWLLPAIAAVLVLALVVGLTLFLGKGNGARSVSTISGTYKSKKLAANKYSQKTIEIPKQPGADYMIATESNQMGVVTSVNDKTATSFDLVVYNAYTKDRTPTITWTLIPGKAGN